MRSPALSDVRGRGMWAGAEIDPRFAKNIERHIRQAIKEDPFHVSANTDPKGDRVFPFDQAADALRHMESGAHFGKIVVRVDWAEEGGQ